MAAKKKKLEFSGYILTVNDEAPLFKEIKAKIKAGKYPKRISATNYSFTVEYIQMRELKEYFMRIYIEYGHPFPRAKFLVNQNTQKQRENPRTGEEYEPKQDFILVDFKRSSLWLCNSNRKGLFIDFLNSFDIQHANVIEVYNEKAFVSHLKKLNDIKISVVPELFSQNSTLSKELVNEINGYGAVRATIHFHYSHARVSDRIRKMLSNVLKQKDSFKSIRIAGRDEQNVGMLFNSEIFSKKISTETTVDENERFIPKYVFEKLIGGIRNEKA